MARTIVLILIAAKLLRYWFICRYHAASKIIPDPNKKHTEQKKLPGRW